MRNPNRARGCETLGLFELARSGTGADLFSRDAFQGCSECWLREFFLRNAVLDCLVKERRCQRAVPERAIWEEEELRSNLGRQRVWAPLCFSTPRVLHTFASTTDADADLFFHLLTMMQLGPANDTLQVPAQVPAQECLWLLLSDRDTGQAIPTCTCRDLGIHPGTDMCPVPTRIASTASC